MGTVTEELEILKQGAEAKLFITNYLGRPTLIKERFIKKYRNSELDSTITKERIKNEARSIVRCKAADINTPALYLVDFDRRRIYMQHFEDSITVKDYIIKTTNNSVNLNGSGSNILDTIAIKIGKILRKMHDNNIIHGDLTTSNMLLIKKNFKDGKDSEEDFELVMIDFGLSFIDSSTEDKGVDLYVLERALISTHNDHPDLFTKVLNAYKSNSNHSVREIMSKFEEVRARGRKRTMIG